MTSKSPMNKNVSVVMTTYDGDTVSDLDECFESLIHQTRQPDEVLVVRGNDLRTELEETIIEFESTTGFTVRDISITERGRGYARKVGIKKASSEFVAIIDSDDIACPNRIQDQLEYLCENPSIDVVGGYIEEFETVPEEIIGVREVPTNPDDVERMAYYRCPINHPTVMFRRDAVIEVGNYREMEYGEDYELWCRLLANNKNIDNIPKVLVKARASGLIGRRRGRRIARHEIELQRAIVRSGFYGWSTAVLNLGVRIPLRLLPERLVRGFYYKFLRT